MRIRVLDGPRILITPQGAAVHNPTEGDYMPITAKTHDRLVRVIGTLPDPDSFVVYLFGLEAQQVGEIAGVPIHTHPSLPPGRAWLLNVQSLADAPALLL